MAQGGRSASGSMVTKIAVVLFLLAVVGAECLVVFLFLPGHAETAVMAGVGHQTKQPEAAKVETSEAAEDEGIPQLEVDLGEFSVTSYQPVSNTTLRIDFHLYGTVASEDEKAFQTALQSNVHRFRDQVIVTVRSSDVTDLTDAGLGLIKRKILEKTNAMLGKRFLKTVIFSDFSFIEQ